MRCSPAKGLTAILIVGSGAKRNAPQLLDLVSGRELDSHSPGSIWIRVNLHSHPLGSGRGSLRVEAQPETQFQEYYARLWPIGAREQGGITRSYWTTAFPTRVLVPCYGETPAENVLPLEALGQCWNVAPLGSLASSRAVLVPPSPSPSPRQDWVQDSAAPRRSEGRK